MESKDGDEIRTRELEKLLLTWPAAEDMLPAPRQNEQGRSVASGRSQLLDEAL
jgi:hypothetical protein